MKLKELLNNPIDKIGDLEITRQHLILIGIIVMVAFMLIYKSVFR